MNRERAEELLSNLLERGSPDPDGKLKVDALTRREVEALRFLLADLVPLQGSQENIDTRNIGEPIGGSKSEVSSVAEPKNSAQPSKVTISKTFTSSSIQLPSDLNLNSLLVENKNISKNQKVALCIDFGTAMSKAFAMRGSQEPIELALGKRAGASGYIIDSSLFITDDGLIFFGPDAARKSEGTTETDRSRADSLKARFSQGSMVDLRTLPVKPAINPTETPFSEDDLITLYLSYLTDLMATELEGQNYSRYTLRRFARPCWSSERNDWAEPVLRRMLAASQVLADTFQGRWKEGISVAEAKSALTAVSQLDDEQLPTYLVSLGIEEPVAAAAALVLDEDEAQIEIFLVIDVGAGTTDFGAFILQHNPLKEVFVTRYIPGTVAYINQAGNRVDDLLKYFIFDAAGIDAASPEGQHSAHFLNDRIRLNKETLFRDGSVEVKLPNDYRQKVIREDFLTSQRVANFSKTIEDKFVEILSSLNDGYIKKLVKNGLNVVLTGGGANLPMLTSLATGIIEIKGHKIMRRKSPMVPAWIESKYPQFSSQYLQLAVAIGGAAEVLPVAGDSFDDLYS